MNYPRRIYPFFKNLKKETELSDLVRVRVSGKNWGLASNAIHMLDLFSFLTKHTKMKIDFSRLNNKILSSKRNGYIEFTGKLYATTSKGDSLQLIDSEKIDSPFKINIEFNNKRLEIFQEQELVVSYLDGKQCLKDYFYMPLQSEMTAGVVKNILKNHNSGLSSLDESFDLNCNMLNGFNSHLSSIYNKKINVCPIT